LFAPNYSKGNECFSRPRIQDLQYLTEAFRLQSVDIQNRALIMRLSFQMTCPQYEDSK